jgi:hypothetical protein
MFTRQAHNRAGELTGRARGHPESGQDRKPRPELNPVWQSLAIRADGLLPRVTIGQADDPSEREADRVAEQVSGTRTRQATGHAPSIAPPGPRHPGPAESPGKEREETGERSRGLAGTGARSPDAAPPIVHEMLRSPGQPLDPATRSYFELRFGRSFAGVRLHTGEQAKAAARTVEARAFTVDEHIAFASGEAAPHLESGRRLLAHELTHVAQQALPGGGRGGLLQRKSTDEEKACLEPPAVDVATVDRPSSECIIERRGAAIWTARLWDFERDEKSLTSCQAAALDLLVSDVDSVAAANPEIIGWSVTSIAGHASPEGEEDYNEGLALGRAESVFMALEEATIGSPLFRGLSPPVSGGEACSEDVPRASYPHYRAVDVVIEFLGESPAPLPTPKARPAEESDPRASEDLATAGVSHELGDPQAPTAEELAVGLPATELAFLQGLDEDRRAVMSWLRLYGDEIQMQEILRGVDRRAIAGAIAWEALVNVRSSARLTRGSGGPGKVHVQTSHGPDTRSAAPAEVEERGLIAEATYEERLRLLGTPTGAIDYIGAIMQAMAQDAEMSGFDIWRDPAVLTWGYHSKYVDTFRERMEEKVRAGETTFDTSHSDMAVWTVGNLHYLELCVGQPTARNTAPVRPSLEPLPGGPTP